MVRSEKHNGILPFFVPFLLALCVRLLEKVLEQPYDSRPLEIRKLHEEFRYRINEASSTVVDIESGKRNVEEFVKHYKSNNDYIFIKMFSEAVFSGIEYNRCIVKVTDGEVKKLRVP